MLSNFIVHSRNCKGHPLSRLLLQATNGALATLTLFLAGASLVMGTDSPIYSDSVPIIPTLDSNLRFMGGLGVGLGLTLLWLTPSIEKHTLLFRTIWLCALAGGIGRLVSVAVVGFPSTPILVFTLIEVPGVPLLIYWQHCVAKATARE